MLAIEVSLNVFWLPFTIIISALAGFSLRSMQIVKSRKRVLSLENEMLNNHAEILRLQQELVALQKNFSGGSKSKVVSMKDPMQEEKKDNPEKPERRVQ